MSPVIATRKLRLAVQLGRYNSPQQRRDAVYVNWSHRMPPLAGFAGLHR